MRKWPRKCPRKIYFTSDKAWSDEEKSISRDSIRKQNTSSRAILCKMNLAIVFCMCQVHHTGLSLSLYCIKKQVPITHEGFPGKNSSMINRNVSNSVTSVFKTSWSKGHFWSYAEAKTILKRVCSHQNKENTKQLFKTFEYTITNFEMQCFSLAFTISS